MADLQTMLARFGFVTVIKPTFYEVGSATPLFTIDSLRISNITQEGPTKTVKGGLYANTQMRYGKTMRLEMEDVVGRIEVLKRLMGANFINGLIPTDRTDEAVFVAYEDEQSVFTVQYEVKSATTPVVLRNGVAEPATFVNNVFTITTPANVVTGDIISITYTYVDENVEKVQITDKFAPAVKIMGQTFVIDSVTGNKQWVQIHFPKFLPDSVFEQTMEAEGDFGAMNIAGDILANDCGVFYEFLIDGTAPSCE